MSLRNVPTITINRFMPAGRFDHAVVQIASERVAGSLHGNLDEISRDEITSEAARTDSKERVTLRVVLEPRQEYELEADRSQSHYLLLFTEVRQETAPGKFAIDRYPFFLENDSIESPWVDTYLKQILDYYKGAYLDSEKRVDRVELKVARANVVLIKQIKAERSFLELGWETQHGQR